MNLEPELVDQVVLEEQLNELAAAPDLNVGALRIF